MKQKNIINLLDTRQTYHCTQSITRWKQAINAFENRENPNRVLLYDMYEDILLDGQLECTWQKRIDAILNRRITFVRDGEENDEVNRLLASTDMRRFVHEILNTIAYGFTLLQVNNIYYDEEKESFAIDFDLVPRKHVHPEAAFQCVSRDQHVATRDFLFTEKPLSRYMVFCGSPLDKGLFIKAAPYVIYKRGAFGDWAQFSEMFGMPFREAIYDAYDDDTRQRINEFMKEWASEQFLVHNRDVEVKIHQTQGSAASADIYNKFIAVCDAAISKTILGNTLTTDQGDRGARSLGEVHLIEQTAKEQSDELFVLSVLNTQFRAVLKTFGIDATNGYFQFAETETDWADMQAKWNVIQSVANRVPVSDDYIYEQMRIPKPDNYDQIKAQQAQGAKEPTEPPTTEEKKTLASRLADFFWFAP